MSAEVVTMIVMRLMSPTNLISPWHPAINPMFSLGHCLESCPFSIPRDRSGAMPG